MRIVLPIAAPISGNRRPARAVREPDQQFAADTHAPTFAEVGAREPHAVDVHAPRQAFVVARIVRPARR
jgi:hypothetical protein